MNFISAWYFWQNPSSPLLPPWRKKSAKQYLTPSLSLFPRFKISLLQNKIVMMFWPRPVEPGGVGGRDRGPLILKSQGEGGERVNKMNHRINCSSESLQKMPTSLEMLFSACCTNPNWFFVRRLTMQQQDHPWKRSPLHLQLSSVSEEGTASKDIAWFDENIFHV